MDTRAVADLRSLAGRDTELAERADRLRALDAQVSSIRTRAETIDAFLAGYPAEKSRRREAVEAAQAELDRRRGERDEAERDLAAARDAETRARAEAIASRARDHVAVAQATLDRAAAAAEELERDATSLPEEVPLLHTRARAVAGATEHVPEPPQDVRELVDWASHAHAELFVAAGQIDVQRERVIREANELASMLLGEPTYGSTVAQLAERVFPLAGE
ncbi:MAG TPA: hypothetical protein VI408_03370 [Gaiellaceae bacterium]